MANEDTQENSKEAKTVCRDFIRNVCTRGRGCKFKHPTSEELTEIVDCSHSSTIYEFCHDFVNNGQCQRANCKFIHCAKEVEDLYHAQKLLPLRLKYHFDFGGDCATQGGADKASLERGILEAAGRPICRDFLSRECFRGKKCKFFHPDLQRAAKLLLAATMDNLERENESGGGLAAKRARIQEDADDICLAFRDHLASENELAAGIVPHKNLQEENHNLKRRVHELEKQVSDLAATNEVLLEQNAQFRLQKRGIASYKLTAASSSSGGVAINQQPAMNQPAMNQQQPTHRMNPQPANNQPLPVQLNVQVAAQERDYMNGPGQNGQQQQTGPAPHPSPMQVPVTVPPHSGAIVAQVLAANIANSGGNVDTMQPATNQQLQMAGGPPPQVQTNNQLIPPNMQQPQQQQINQQPQPVQASFAAPMPTNHNQQQQQQPMGQQMGSFACGPMPAHRTVMAAAHCAPHSAGGHQTHGVVGSMCGPGMPMQQQPTLVYTATRATENGPLVSHQLVAGSGTGVNMNQGGQNPAVSSMPQPVHPAAVNVARFNNVSMATQAGIVHESTYQTPAYSCSPMTSYSCAPMTSYSCAPMTSCVNSANNVSMQPTVSRGGVRPVV